MSSSGSISSELKAVPVTDEVENVVPYKTCTITGENNEFVIIGDHKYFRHELMQAFGGTFNPGLAPYPKQSFGNPAAIGLVSTGMNILIFGLFFAHAMGVHIPNAGIGLCMFMGGLVEILAGIWGFFVGSQVGTFVLTVFTSYGAFWLSFGAIFIPSFGIGKAYEEDPEQLNQAIGLMLIGWAIFTTMLLMCVVKSTLSFFWALLTYDLTIILFAAGFLSGNDKVKVAGGIMGVINAFADWFEAFAGVANRQNSYLVPKEIPLPNLALWFKRKRNARKTSN